MSTDQRPDTADAWREARKQARVHGYTDEPDGLAFAAGWNAARAELANLRQSLTEAEASHQAEIGRLRAELALAIAHDRQPYPTAEAYESTCRALEKHRQRAEAAEAERDRLRAERAKDQAEMLEATEVINAATSLIPTVKAERAALAARLATAEQVVEVAKHWRQYATARALPPMLTRWTERLMAAVDAYRATRTETNGIGDQLAAAEAERDALRAVYHAAKDALDRNLLAGCGTAKAVLAEAVAGVNNNDT